MKTVVAVSPHLDDAAFSAGATLARLARRGWRVIVATVFTGSVARPKGFALACQLDKGLPPEADYMALRRAEDEAACRSIGATPHHLCLLEAPHRGYQDAAALFSGVRPDDNAAGDIARALTPVLDRANLVIGPRALGGHVDHVLVRQVLRGTGCRVWYWGDWPYAGRAAPSDPFALVDAAARRVAVPVDARDLAAKTRACLAYASQLGFQFGGADAASASIASVGREVFLRPRGEVTASTKAPRHPPPPDVA